MPWSAKQQRRCHRGGVSVVTLGRRSQQRSQRRSLALVDRADRVADVADGEVVHAGAGIEIRVVAGQAAVASRGLAVDVIGAFADADVDAGVGPRARAERAGRTLAGPGGGAWSDALAGGDAARAAFGAGRTRMAGVAGEAEVLEPRPGRIGGTTAEDEQNGSDDQAHGENAICGAVDCNAQFGKTAAVLRRRNIDSR